ncbi:MAG TPA: HNH endonuclease [Anaerolineaceae bacterium]|nr:HNH endonuclease [Anaerolineaceae bacterium]
MSDQVLVLNANFEPINICDLRRAFGLILTEKATLVSNGRGFYYTVNQKFPIPSIIRLNRMINRPRAKVNLSRKEIFRRDNFSCQYCGNHASNLTIDHVLPKHLGGDFSWENLVTACSICNHKKGGRTLQNAGMKLLRTPHPPPANAVYIFSRHSQFESDWMPFLKGW